MNRTARFGYDIFGGYITVKLNACLTKSNIEALQCDYKEWLSLYPGYKGRTRIEGVLPINFSTKFYTDIKLAILRSKIDRLKEQEKSVLSDYMDIDTTRPSFNDSNFF